MALFGGRRDISLFRRLNKELINEFVDTTVDILKSSLLDANDNLYGEALGKTYFPAVRVGALITHDDQEWGDSEFGVDVNQSSQFAFLRDELKDVANLVLEVGDIIDWNNAYWEIDSIIENQYTMGKNPDTSNAGCNFGWNQSIVCNTHMTRRSRISIERTNTGTPDKDYNMYKD